MDLDRTDELLTPPEVARMLCVNPKTVSRWSRAGRFPTIKTVGGHRRFRRADIERAIERAQDLNGELIA